MKVAFITPSYPNISISGGSLYAYYLAHALDKYVDLSVFLPNINLSELNNDLRYVPINMPIRRAPITWTLLYLFRVKQKLEEDYFDVIHVNERGGLFLRELDVVTFHHSPENLFEHIIQTHTHMEAIKSKTIVTVSEQSKLLLSKLCFLKKDKIRVVPNGISPYFFHADDRLVETLKKKYGLENKKSIIYVNSNFSKRKNLPFMLETTKFLKNYISNVRLLIICKERYRKPIMEQVKSKKIDDVTIYISNPSTQELVCLYRLSDLLAMPSLREGFGLPLIESVAVRKPFVSFDVGVASELAERGYGVIAKNEEDFKEKCLNLLIDPIVLEREAVEYIKETYSWENSAKKLISIYEELD